MADIRCPMCGKINPSGLDICQFCMARLTPLQDSFGEHDPHSSIEDLSDASPDLPDWMKEMRETSEPVDPDLSDDWTSEDLDRAQGTATDWLNRIQKTPPDSVGDKIIDEDEVPFEAEEPDLLSQFDLSERDETVDVNQISKWLNELLEEEVEDQSEHPDFEVKDREDSLAYLDSEPPHLQLSDDQDLDDLLIFSLDDEEEKPVSDFEDVLKTGEQEADSEAYLEQFQEEDELPEFKNLETAFDEPTVKKDKVRLDQAEIFDLDSKDDNELSQFLSTSQDVHQLSALNSQIENESDTQLSPVDLPSWLEAMRPDTSIDQAPANKGKDKKPSIERVGPLAGLSGVLPAEPDIILPGKPSSLSSKLQLTKQQLAHTKMLENLLRLEGEPPSLPTKPLISSQFVLRSIILVILIATTLIPVLFGTLNLGLPDFSSQSFDLNQMISNLSENSPVLMVIDYQPGFSGEMDALSSVILDHLMEKGTYLVFASTVGTGPIQAEHLINQLNTTGAHLYETPQNYVNLGLIAAGPSGIRAFSHMPRQVKPKTINFLDAWESPNLETVKVLSDFAMLIVATENPETGKAWIEQTQPLLGETPLTLLASAQAAPMIQPYYETQPKQIQGYLSGLSSGAEYQSLLGRTASPGNYWSAFSMGVLAALLMIVICAFYFLISNRRTQTDQGNKAKE